MNKKGIKIHYDKESKVLSIEMKRAKSVDSDMHGNVVIDYGPRGEVVRINLYQLDFDVFRKSRRALQRFARSAAIPVAVR